MFKSMAFAGALLVFSGTAQAAGGLLIVQRMTIGETAQSHQVQIENTRMRAESSGATGTKQVIMFDGTKEVMTILYPDTKTYSEMTKADVEKLGAQMSDAMAQLEKMRANISPEQRARIEAALKGRGAASPTAGVAPKIQYKRAGTDKVGKWTCDKYEGFEGATKVSEVCTVDPKVLGFAPGDFEIARQLAAFFKKMAPQASNQNQTFTIGSLEDQGYTGLPVRHSMTIAGRQTTTEITEVSRQTFPDSLFQVPAGYQKTDFMGGRGRGRQ